MGGSKVKLDTVLPFRNLAVLNNRTRPWDSTAAESRIREWADATDGPNTKYSQAFLFVDSENRDNFTGYKLPYADVINGRLVAMPRGIFAAAGSVQGARQPLRVPQGDIAGIRRNISRYYEKMRDMFDDPDIVPPWEAE